MTQTNTIFARAQYGEIIRPQQFRPGYSLYAADLYAETCHLIKLAVKSEKIPASFDSIHFDRKGRAEGGACHHEIYDISADARQLLLCVRQTEGTRYGVRTTSKNYYIITTHGRGVRVVAAPKAIAAKASKLAINPGDAIAVCLGKKHLAGHKPETIIGYKIVAKADDFVSVFDNSPWTIDKTRTEMATKNHTGGFYIFSSITDALDAWNDRLVFAEEWMRAEKYSLLECECSGRRYLHDNKKICCTKVRPTAEIAGLLR